MGPLGPTASLICPKFPLHLCAIFHYVVGVADALQICRHSRPLLVLLFGFILPSCLYRWLKEAWHPRIEQHGMAGGGCWGNALTGWPKSCSPRCQGHKDPPPPQ